MRIASLTVALGAGLLLWAAPAGAQTCSADCAVEGTGDTPAPAPVDPPSDQVVAPPDDGALDPAVDPPVEPPSDVAVEPTLPEAGYESPDTSELEIEDGEGGDVEAAQTGCDEQYGECEPDPGGDEPPDNPDPSSDVSASSGSETSSGTGESTATASEGTGSETGDDPVADSGGEELADESGTLPTTGLGLGAMALAGVALLGAGGVLRRSLA